VIRGIILLHPSELSTRQDFLLMISKLEPDHYTLSFEVKTDYLVARASGMRTLANVKAMTQEIFEKVIANHLTKALIDVRELKGQLKILESYQLVTQVFDKLHGRGMTRAAILDRKISPTGEWFLETVARNRGYNLRIFSEHDEALQWLAS
jgi:hypothetical protein